METKSLKIKVCGMRDKDNLLQLLQLKPDYVGFIFYPPSSRYVGDEFPKEISEIVTDAKKVGVFVNESVDTIKQKIDNYMLDALQLHGHETPEQCKELRENGVEVIKSFPVDDDFNFQTVIPYEKVVDYFLFDTKTVKYGGSGKKFNWDKLNQYHSNKPFFLSGGIGAFDSDEIKQLNNDKVIALDLNSKFEKSPAMKDIALLKGFLNRLRKREEIS